jgi:hypothetical protein
MTTGSERREAEAPWSEPTAEKQAQWARDEAVSNDHYHRVPARDQAERSAYDRIEQAEAGQAEAKERNYHFHGAHPSDYPPHDYQCEHGCPYETDAEQTEREAREAWVEQRREAYYAEMEAEAG